MMPNIAFYSPGTVPWLFYFAVFFLCVFVAWTIPGSILTRIFALSRIKHILISTILGMVMWAWQGIIAGYLHNRFLTFGYLGCMVVLWFHTKQYRYLPRWSDIQSLLKLKYFLLVGIAGIICLQVPLFINGMVTKAGVLFCCTSDTFWYLSLSDILIRRFPPDMPGVNGILLKNYHYFFLMVVSELVRIFQLPLLPTLYQYIRIFYGILYAAIGYVLISAITPNKISRKLFFFFLFFSAELLYIVSFLLTGKMSFDYTPVYISQKMLFNMPMAGATILFFTVLYLVALISRNNFHTSLRTLIKIPTYVRTMGIVFPIALLIGSSIGFKTYIGIVLLFGTGILVLIDFVKERSFFYGFLMVTAGLIAASAFIPVSFGSGGLYVSWFWRVEEFMSFPILHFPKETLESISFWTKQKRLFHAPPLTIMKVLIYEAYFTTIYVISIFGTTLIGLFPGWKGTLISFRYYFFLLCMTLFSLILGMFFLQTTGVGHTYNFLIVSYLLLMILTAIALGQVVNRYKRIGGIVIGIVIALNTFSTLYNIILFTSPSTNGAIFLFSHAEQEATQFLANQQSIDGYVLVDPNNELDYITPYLSAFIHQPLYVSGPYIISALNLPYQNRLSLANQIMKEQDPTIVRKLLEQEKIRYIYVKKTQSFSEIRGGEQIFTSAFSNKEVTIYKAN